MNTRRQVAIACALTLALTASTLSAQSRGKGISSRFQPGGLYRNVACQAAPQYHYDLHVPKGYRRGQPTPVLFVFSPRGRVPMQLFQAAADKLGWLVCGSVESQNGMPWPQYEAIFTALLEEMKSRFTVHPRRAYLTGMSGGSRVAVEMFGKHGDIAAGVIGMAAGRSGRGTPKVPGGAVLGLIGRGDYNYFEFVDANEHLADHGVLFKFVDWDGGHTWAPPLLIGRAMEWLEFQYFIRSPHLTEKEKQRRPRAIESFLKKTIALGPTLEAYETYEALSHDLKDDEKWLKRMTSAMEKLKPQLAPELAAREVFRAAYKQFNINRMTEKALTDLQRQMQQVAAEHSATVYGKRADALAKSLDHTLAMVRRQMRKQEPRR